MHSVRPQTEHLTRKISSFVNDRASAEVRLIYVIGRPIVALDLVADQELLASYTLDSSDLESLSSAEHRGQSTVLDERRLFHLKRDDFLALIDELAILHHIHPTVDDFTFAAPAKLLRVVRAELTKARA